MIDYNLNHSLISYNSKNKILLNSYSKADIYLNAQIKINWKTDNIYLILYFLESYYSFRKHGCEPNGYSTVINWSKFEQNDRIKRGILELFELKYFRAFGIYGDLLMSRWFYSVNVDEWDNKER